MTVDFITIETGVTRRADLTAQRRAGLVALFGARVYPRLKLRENLQYFFPTEIFDHGF